MPDFPPEIITLATEAVTRELRKMPGKRDERAEENIRRLAFDLTTAALDAVAAELGDHAAAKILAHMEAHGPQVTAPALSIDRHLQESSRRAWRRHFNIAARVAARSFLTEDDTLRLAAEAVARGDYMTCPALEDEQ